MTERGAYSLMKSAAPNPTGTATASAISPTRIVPHSSEAMPKVPVSGSQSVRVRKWKPWLWSAGQAPISRKKPISPMITSVDTAAERAAATNDWSCAVGR